MYELKFYKTALDFLNNLEKHDKERIWNKLQQCKLNPFHFLEHLEDIDGFKLTIGDYRAIIDVDNSERTLTVLKIGHRKNIYEN